jgi:hypothetical protein
MPSPTSLLKFMVKHPVLTAGVGGGAYASTQLGQHAEKVEAELMRNRLGAPGGKFVYSELQEFEAKKKHLSEKVAFLKTAEGEFAGAFVGGAGGETARQVIQGVSKGVGRAANKIRDRVKLEPQREKILQQLIEEDPTVSTFEKESPGSSAKAYASMRRFAPELSTDPNVVAAYLREAAQTGGAANYMTIKQLAETEAAINKAQGREP